jgi:hypothetical protein
MLDEVMVVQNFKLISQGITDWKLMCLNCFLNLIYAAGTCYCHMRYYKMIISD